MISFSRTKLPRTNPEEAKRRRRRNERQRKFKLIVSPDQQKWLSSKLQKLSQEQNIAKVLEDLEDILCKFEAYRQDPHRNPNNASVLLHYQVLHDLDLSSEGIEPAWLKEFLEDQIQELDCQSYLGDADDTN